MGNMEICFCRFSFVIAGFGVFVFGLSFQAQEVLLKVPPWFWKHPCDGNIFSQVNHPSVKIVKVQLHRWTGSSTGALGAQLWTSAILKTFSCLDVHCGTKNLMEVGQRIGLGMGPRITAGSL